MNNSNHQHHQSPDFLSPQGRERYQSMAADLMDELTTIRQSQRSRKRRFAAASCAVFLVISGAWLWSALYQPNATAPANRQAAVNEPANIRQNHIINNETSGKRTRSTDQPHSYFVQISKSHSTLVKAYTTAAVKADPVIKVEPLTDEALIEFFRQSGKQVGLIETQGKTIITGDLKITRIPSDDTDPRTPSSNATPIKIISTNHAALCIKYIKTNHNHINAPQLINRTATLS